MVEQFILRERADGNKLTKQIRDRCDRCYVPDCWTLKDPNDKGQIFLSKKLITTGKWRKAQIRHVLFQSTYGEPVPIGRVIRMRCGNKRCINPAHYSVSGWRPPWEVMHRMIDELGWITEEQAKEWYSSKEQTPEPES